MDRGSGEKNEESRESWEKNDAVTEDALKNQTTKDARVSQEPEIAFSYLKTRAGNRARRSCLASPYKCGRKCGVKKIRLRHIHQPHLELSRLSSTLAPGELLFHRHLLGTYHRAKGFNLVRMEPSLSKHCSPVLKASMHQVAGSSLLGVPAQEAVRDTAAAVGGMNLDASVSCLEAGSRLRRLRSPSCV